MCIKFVSKMLTYIFINTLLAVVFLFINRRKQDTIMATPVNFVHKEIDFMYGLLGTEKLLIKRHKIILLMFKENSLRILLRSWWDRNSCSVFS